ncbi:MAG TPA: hypothetical protein VKT70_04735 [Stellaceae bacterium]|nr:hypothetical protein [Stellaceae bacterium]
MTFVFFSPAAGFPSETPGTEDESITFNADGTGTLNFFNTNNQRGFSSTVIAQVLDSHGDLATDTIGADDIAPGAAFIKPTNFASTVSPAPTSPTLDFVGAGHAVNGSTNGLNTLRITMPGDTVTDLTQLNTPVSHVEFIDLNGAGGLNMQTTNHNSLILDARTVFEMSPNTHAVTVLGTGNDTVTLNASQGVPGSTWTQVASHIVGFDVFEASFQGHEVTVAIQHAIDQAHHLHHG